MKPYVNWGMRLIPFGAVVILSACVWKSDYDDLQGRYNSLSAQNQQVQAQNRQIQGENQQLASDLTRLQSAIKYTVNSDLLFPSGSWKMSADGQDTIAKLATQLAPTQRNHIVVNGHTDNAPIGRGLQQAGVTSNEMLSQKRAEAVRDYMVSRGVNADLVEAKGWGEAQPIAPNGSPAGRAQNRRVEIMLAPGG